MARTSAFFGSVTPKAFCQKRLKLSFPAPFFFGSFLFGRTKRNEHKNKERTLKNTLIARLDCRDGVQRSQIAGI